MNKKLHWSEAAGICQRSGEAWVLATVIGTQGSTPRDCGTKMVITENLAYDTLGGGQLEFNIIARARDLIEQKKSQQIVEHIPLSAKAQQCCGGTMTVLLECFCEQGLNIHIFGAGHVARALVSILGQLDARIHWIDSRADEFPENVPNNTKVLQYDNVLQHVNDLQAGAYILIVTHQHTLDYQLLEAVLDRKDSAYIGLIGSDAKAARFRKRLKSASFSDADIDSVHCPVGLSDVPGKQPIEVAVSIAAQLIQYSHSDDKTKKDKSTTEQVSAINNALAHEHSNQSAEKIEK
nr:xanthine dehydrogenase accessory protein XdhC [Agarilytica rhodophyticola]